MQMLLSFPSWLLTGVKRLNVVAITSIYEKTLIQHQNVEHQMVEHFQIFELEICIIYITMLASIVSYSVTKLQLMFRQPLGMSALQQLIAV